MSTEEETKCPICNQPMDKDNRCCLSCNTSDSSDNISSATHAAIYNLNSSQNYLSGDGISGSQMGFGFKLSFVHGECLDDKYRIVRELDRGGFGAVYEAEDIELNERIALKVIVDENNNSRWAGEQLRKYFRQHNQIKDTSHIIKTHDPRCCKYKGLSLVLLPMELAESSLRQWLISNQNLKKRRNKALALFRQACAGIKAMHEAGLLHLDIKPENILIVDGRAKISDFGTGISNSDQFSDDIKQLLPEMTGTAQYMSPEQFKNNALYEISHASDIYSLGIILYEILSGTLPFSGNRDELRENHLHCPPPPIKGLSHKYRNIISICLGKNPDDRYTDTDKLIDALNQPEESTQTTKGKKDSTIWTAIGHGLLWFLKGIFVGLGYLILWIAKGLLYVGGFVGGAILGILWGIIKGFFTVIFGGGGVRR